MSRSIKVGDLVKQNEKFDWGIEKTDHNAIGIVTEVRKHDWCENHAKINWMGSDGIHGHWLDWWPTQYLEIINESR